MSENKKEEEEINKSLDSSNKRQEIKSMR